MGKIKWTRPNSAFRDSKDTHEAIVGGMRMEIYFDTTCFPQKWKLNCLALGIKNWNLQSKFDESKKDAIGVIKLQLKEKIKHLKKVLSKLK